MAEDSGREDSGSKDRATVALVDAKVDGLRELIRAEFMNIKEDVKALGAIVGDVIRHGVDIADHERRITRIESDAISESDYKRKYRPSMWIAAFALLVAIAAVVVPLLAGAYHH